MKLTNPFFLAAALGAVSIASLRMAGGVPPTADPPASLSYATSCAVIDSSSADGFVTNQSRDTYQIIGPARFVFSAADSMSRPVIVYTANSIVGPGETVRVASVKLAFQPLPAETCRFEVKDSVRRQ